MMASRGYTFGASHLPQLVILYTLISETNISVKRTRCSATARPGLHRIELPYETLSRIITPSIHNQQCNG